MSVTDAPVCAPASFDDLRGDHAVPPSGVVLRDLLRDAVSEEATSLHVEVRGERVDVRMRVAGSLRRLPAELSAAQVDSMVGTLAGSPGEPWMIAGRSIAVDFVDEETVDGRSVLVRMREVRAPALGLDELGLAREVVAGVRSALDEPRGLLLVVGTTASGRSTTMRAALESGAAGGRKVIACGDHLVAASSEVAQVCVHGSEAEVAARVRSVAGHDVDVLGVDVDAGAPAVAASVSAAHRGAVVVMTGFAHDAADALEQLQRLGVGAGEIATNVRGVLVQHMAQRLCGGCRQQAEADPGLAAELFGPAAPSLSTSFVSAGCGACGGSGVSGQVPIAEFLPIGSAVRRALRRGVAAHDLAALTPESGGASFAASAHALVARGEVSLQEVQRVLGSALAAGREQAPAGHGVRCS